MWLKPGKVNPPIDGKIIQVQSTYRGQHVFERFWRFSIRCLAPVLLIYHIKVCVSCLLIWFKSTKLIILLSLWKVTCFLNVKFMYSFGYDFCPKFNSTLVLKKNAMKWPFSRWIQMIAVLFITFRTFFFFFSGEVSFDYFLCWNILK